MSEQDENLERVSSKIGAFVRSFFRERWSAGQKFFFVKELHEYVSDRAKVAPASSDRVLRDLRWNGQLDYRVVDRRASRYEILSAEPKP
jgi:hypothetical protein